MFNEKIKYSHLDNFQIITALRFLETKQLMQHIIFDNQNNIFYIDLHNSSFAVAVTIPAYEIVDFSLNFLKSIDFKGFVDFLIDEYIPIYDDMTPLTDFKYEQNELFKNLYKDILPSFEKIIIELFDNQNRLKQMREKDILTPIAKYLLSAEMVENKYKSDMKPYNALYDFLDSEGIALPKEANIVLQDYLKKSDSQIFKQVFKNCFKEIETQKFKYHNKALTIENKSMLIELLDKYSASKSLSDFQKNYFSIKDDGKRILDRNFNEFMPYIFSPKFDAFDKTDNITIFGDIDDNVLLAPLNNATNLLSIDYFNLKLTEKIVREKVLKEGRVTRELFDELMDIETLPKVYTSKENIFKKMVSQKDKLEISGDNNFREQMCQFKVLLGFYVELLLTKPAEEIKEFNDYLSKLNKNKMYCNRSCPKELLIDINSKLFKEYYPIFNQLSNVEWNCIIEQFLKFKKLSREKEIAPINIYPILFEKFKYNK